MQKIKPKLSPLQSVLFVGKTSVKEVPKNKLTPNVIGEKAYGLACLPPTWTLPFLVISDELFSKSKKTDPAKLSELAKGWASRILTAAQRAGIAKDAQIIVRSS